jgi:hypothetical protein
MNSVADFKNLVALSLTEVFFFFAVIARKRNHFGTEKKIKCIMLLGL